MGRKFEDIFEKESAIVASLCDEYGWEHVEYDAFDHDIEIGGVNVEVKLDWKNQKSNTGNLFLEFCDLDLDGSKVSLPERCENYEYMLYLLLDREDNIVRAYFMPIGYVDGLKTNRKFFCGLNNSSKFDREKLALGRIVPEREVDDQYLLETIEDIYTIMRQSC